MDIDIGTCREMNVYEVSSMTRDSSRCGEREEEDALRLTGGGEPGYLKVEREGTATLLMVMGTLGSSGPTADGRACAEDLVGARCSGVSCPNYESPGHTCSLEAHQCYRYWKIILAANLSSDEFHQGYKCRKRSLGFL